MSIEPGLVDANVLVYAMDVVFAALCGLPFVGYALRHVADTL